MSWHCRLSIDVHQREEYMLELRGLRHMTRQRIGSGVAPVAIQCLRIGQGQCRIPLPLLDSSIFAIFLLPFPTHHRYGYVAGVYLIVSSGLQRLEMSSRRPTVIKPIPEATPAAENGVSKGQDVSAFSREEEEVPRQYSAETPTFVKATGSHTSRSAQTTEKPGPKEEDHASEHNPAHPATSLVSRACAKIRHENNSRLGYLLTAISSKAFPPFGLPPAGPIAS
jgi:hypothetical protein